MNILKILAVALCAVLTRNALLAMTFPDRLVAVTQPGKVDWSHALALIHEAEEQGKVNELGQSGLSALTLLTRQHYETEESVTIDSLTFLLMNSSNVNAVNKYGETIVTEWLCSRNGKKHWYLENLLKSKADPNKLGRKWPPLYGAVGTRDNVAVELLLQYGATIDEGLKDGTTPLYRAVEDASFEIANLLLKKKADMNKRNAEGASAKTALNSRPLKIAEYLKIYIVATLAELVKDYLFTMIPQVSVGDYHTCAITREGSLFCWGDYEVSHILDVPKELKDANVVQVSTGSFHACAITLEGELFCWGYNRVSQCDVPSELRKKKVREVSAGAFHTCAITEASELFCWGHDKAYDCTPGIVPSWLHKTPIRQVSARYLNTCVVTEAGRVFCWGESYDIPKKLEQLEIRQVSTGNAHRCAITEIGELFCWGDNFYHQIEIPRNLEDQCIREVSAGGNHTCAVTVRGELFCWGYNNHEQINIPIELKSGNVRHVSAGDHQTCATTEAGQLFCWGKLTSNQIGFLVSQR